MEKYQLVEKYRLNVWELDDVYNIAEYLYNQQSTESLAAIKERCLLDAQSAKAVRLATAELHNERLAESNMEFKYEAVKRENAALIRNNARLEADHQEWESKALTINSMANKVKEINSRLKTENSALREALKNLVNGWNDFMKRDGGTPSREMAAAEALLTGDGGIATHTKSLEQRSKDAIKESLEYRSDHDIDF